MKYQSLGRWGEDEACKYLLAHGYKIVEKNFRNKLGEIDLVAKDGRVLCFVEVKTRVSSQYGAPFESISPIKRRKMVQMAHCYMMIRYHSVDILSRFDVVSIRINQQGQPEIKHIVNAFDLTQLM